MFVSQSTGAAPCGESRVFMLTQPCFREIWTMVRLQLIGRCGENTDKIWNKENNIKQKK
jgi:hypothetical protein